MVFKFLKKSPKEIFKPGSWEGKMDGSPIQKGSGGSPEEIKDFNLSFNCYTGSMFTLIKNCKSCMMEHSDEELCNLFYQTKTVMKISRKEKQKVAEMMASTEQESDFEAVAALSAVLTQRQLYRILCDATLIFRASKSDPDKPAYKSCHKLLKAVAAGEIDGYVDAVSYTLGAGVSENLIAPTGWSTEAIPKRRSFFSRVKSGHTCEALVPNCMGNAVLGLAITGDAITMERDEFMRFTREFNISCDGFVLTGDSVHLTGDEVVTVCDHEANRCQFDMLPDTIYVGWKEDPGQMFFEFVQLMASFAAQQMEELDTANITEVSEFGFENEIMTDIEESGFN